VAAVGGERGDDVAQRRKAAVDVLRLDESVAWGAAGRRVQVWWWWVGWSEMMLLGGFGAAKRP
jgi:hypothetical protein